MDLITTENDKTGREPSETDNFSILISDSSLPGLVTHIYRHLDIITTENDKTGREPSGIDNLSILISDSPLPGLITHIQTLGHYNHGK